MRLLHTSDWHIGAELEGISRAEEHEHFFQWLISTIESREIDVLLIAGDVFHQENPSASSQAAWYRVLLELARIPHLKKIIVVGGNHDSASRLNAPRELLGAFKVHVVGGWSEEESELALVPIEGASGQVELVVAAVPYVNGHRLGISTFGKDAEDIRQQTVQKFSALYGSLAERAKQAHPRAVLVGMGHLTCDGSDEADYHTPIHHVGTIQGLPGSIFGHDYSYVALGHIHRAYPVTNSKAWYSGSPLGLRFTRSEMSPRKVVVVDIDPATKEASAKTELYPVWRELKEFRADEKDMVRQLRGYKPEAPGGALVNLVVLRQGVLADAHAKFQAEVAENVRIVSIRFEDPTARTLEEREAIETPAAHQVTPTSVFDYFFAKKFGREPSTAERLAFEEAVQGVEAD